MVRIPNTPIELIRDEPLHGEAAFRLAWGMTCTGNDPLKSQVIALRAARALLKTARAVIRAEEAK